MPNTRIAPALRAKPMGISLPPNLAREARMHAYSHGMSLSKFVSQLLLRELESIQGHRFKPDNPDGPDKPDKSDQSSFGLGKLPN